MRKLTFKTLAEVFEKLEATTLGTEMRRILSEFFKNCPENDIDKACYLMLGQIGPQYAAINIGMAEKMILKAIASAAQKSIEYITNLFKKSGDVGLTAEAIAFAKEPKLLVEDVFNTLHKIAGETGEGSVERKIKHFSDLLSKATKKEARYIARIALSTLRLGAGDMTLLDSLSIAFTGTKANKPILEHAYNIRPDIGFIAKTIAERGLEGIKKVDIALGTPIQMMLAQRVKSTNEILEHMPGVDIAVEEKYDGERVQAHKKGNEIVLYSRRLENITYQFPDVIEEILKAIKAKDCIIEGEIVPIDEKGDLLPFQILMQRRRKYEIEKYVKAIPVCLYLFDLLYLDGKSYIRKNLKERRAALEKILPKETKHLQLAKGTICRDVDCIEEFFNRAVERGCEGILAKSSEGVYQAGTRGWLWIKWKREYTKEMRDTFDLVVVGAFLGRGRRAGTYGALLCAAYNPKLDRFETFCKLGSGFTDAQLAELPKIFKKYVIPHKSPRVEVTKEMQPDVWFDPAIVVEVIGAEITRSPVHTAAMEEGQGLALRFPRFIRYRPEKKPEQATTLEEIIQIFKRR